MPLGVFAGHAPEPPDKRMQITSNTTPFLAERFVSTDKSGQKHCVVVVKATFNVKEQGRCEPAPEQTPFVYCDQHHGDPGMTSVRFESDFAPVKPRVDVLVHASAVSPRGEPVSRLQVGFAGAGIQKLAVVSGDRIWTLGITGIIASSPSPFTSMPLSWDRAFGGGDQSHENETKHGSDLRNHTGVGFHLNDRDDSILNTALPNVERHGDLMSAWSDKPQPIGFAPVGRGWLPRIGFAGTYDRHWFETRRPFLPENFDARHFQAAPLDQQLERLDAGTRFTCANMSPGGAFAAETPAFDIPVTFRFDNRDVQAIIHADTLILEPGCARLTLLGRASVPLPRKLAQLREIQVGKRRYTEQAGKPHFASLSDLAGTLGQGEAKG